MDLTMLIAKLTLLAKTFRQIDLTGAQRSPFITMASDYGSVASKSSASNYRKELAANVVMNGGKLTNRMLSKDDRAWRCEALFKYASTLPCARKNKLVKAVEVEQRRTADLETTEEPMPQLPASAPAPAPTPVPGEAWAGLGRLGEGLGMYAL